MNVEGVDGTASEASPAYGTACFLCLRSFSEDVEGTLEDVVPKWLIKQQGLASEGADLPSGQLFGYTKRKVPCCWHCNQFMSKNLELPVSEAFRAGHDAVAQLSPLLLLLWLGKLMYGTRYRETGLRVDVRDPSAPTMLTTEQLLGRLEYLRLALLTAPQDLTLGAPL